MESRFRRLVAVMWAGRSCLYDLGKSPTSWLMILGSVYIAGFAAGVCVTSLQPKKMTPVTYHPTHSRAIPPPDQVISTEAKNILLRKFYERSEEVRSLRQKRAASEHLIPEHGCKQPRASTSQ